MEPIAIFIILAVGLTVLVAWSVLFSTRDWGGYDPHYPGHGYPYQPPWTYPYQPQGSAPGAILNLVFAGFMLFAAMRYCDRMEKNAWPEDQDEPRVEAEQEYAPANEMQVGGDEEFRLQTPPQSYDETGPDVSPPSPSTSPADKPLSQQLFVQISASNSDTRVLDAAMQLQHAFPGRVWIGEKESDWENPFKILVGPYDSAEAAGAAHGADAWVRRPAAEGITLYRPE